MNNLRLSHEPIKRDILIGANPNGTTYIDISTICGTNGMVFSSDEVLKLRDWFDARVRQLVFEGHLAEHLGD